MELLEQVCSLESAKNLRELGVTQNSLWYWVKDGDADVVISDTELIANGGLPTNANVYSAFTVAELGELLKNIALRFPKWCNKTQGDPDGWCWDDPIPIYRTALAAEKEADARAKQLLFLKEYCK